MRAAALAVENDTDSLCTDEDIEKESKKVAPSKKKVLFNELVQQPKNNKLLLKAHTRFDIAAHHNETKMQQIVNN